MIIKKFEDSKSVKYMQEGGAVPAEAPAQGGAEEQLAQIAQQLVQMLAEQLGDPQAIMAVLQMAAEMVQGAGQPQEQQFMRCGGKIKKVSKKCSKKC